MEMLLMWPVVSATGDCSSFAFTSRLKGKDHLWWHLQVVTVSLEHAAK